MSPSSEIKKKEEKGEEENEPDKNQGPTVLSEIVYCHTLSISIKIF